MRSRVRLTSLALAIRIVGKRRCVEKQARTAKRLDSLVKRDKVPLDRPGPDHVTNRRNAYPKMRVLRLGLSDKNALMALSMWLAFTVIDNQYAGAAGPHPEFAQAGTAIAGTIGGTIFLVIWLAGAVILGSLFCNLVSPVVRPAISEAGVAAAAIRFSNWSSLATTSADSEGGVAGKAAFFFQLIEPRCNISESALAISDNCLGAAGARGLAELAPTTAQGRRLCADIVEKLKFQP